MTELSPDRYYAAIKEGTGVLAGIVAGHDPGLPIPTCPEWGLRQLAMHVGSVHRWVAEVTGRRRHQDPDRAVNALPPGAVMHLHASDDGLDGAGEWLVRQGSDRISVERGHGRGDVAVSGPAASLLLMLVRRRPAVGGDLTVYGDPGLLSGWLDGTPY